MSYADRIKRVLTPPERVLFKRLNTPQKIQDYLDRLPINFEMRGETYMSPCRVFKTKTAHCFEGALLAAAALAYHGERPLLLDFQTDPDDEDHVVTLFRQNGFWGALSKTNHAVLRYRDPVYESVRELAMSYFHEYLKWSGKKSLRAYSAPFNLSKYSPERWISADKELFWLVDALDRSRHFPIVPPKNRRVIRKASKTEIAAMKVVEWKPPRGFKSSAR
ncbi:MAG: hypothetical protein HYS26_03010 [Candidatus Kaiserbacteria bacterium]|nr:MAG: hypothetical protein HYS26_03010 [Candidatus Kaiserbacteria bacterium]